MMSVPDLSDGADGHAVEDLADTRGNDHIAHRQAVGDHNTNTAGIAKLHLLGRHGTAICDAPDKGTAIRARGNRRQGRAQLRFAARGRGHDIGRHARQDHRIFRHGHGNTPTICLCGAVGLHGELNELRLKHLPRQRIKRGCVADLVGAVARQSGDVRAGNVKGQMNHIQTLQKRDALTCLNVGKVLDVAPGDDAIKRGSQRGIGQTVCGHFDLGINAAQGRLGGSNVLGARADLADAQLLFLRAQIGLRHTGIGLRGFKLGTGADATVQQFLRAVQRLAGLIHLGLGRIHRRLQRDNLFGPRARAQSVQLRDRLIPAALQLRDLVFKVARIDLCQHVTGRHLCRRPKRQIDDLARDFERHHHFARWQNDGRVGPIDDFIGLGDRCNLGGADGCVLRKDCTGGQCCDKAQKSDELVVRHCESPRAAIRVF
mmetsp:Transcript_22790/g.37822  ORF Transcript_22790/g.37822 Transcript_22790/m.37822 type:complete len:430 (+) Transcript_22790:96-1385(+)